MEIVGQPASVAVFCLAGGAPGLQRSLMSESVAIIGAGVSGLSCGVVLAERGHHISISAKEIGQQTTSGAAAAGSFTYDAELGEQVIQCASATYEALVANSREPCSA